MPPRKKPSYDFPNAIDLRTFDLSKIKSPARIVVIGASGSGKTVLIRDIMYTQRKKLPEGIVLSGTVEGRKNYSEFIPRLFIYPSYDSNTVKKFVNNQMLKVSRAHQNKQKINSGMHGFLIMDDCFYEAKEWNKAEEMQYIFTNSRNDNVFFILSMQFMMGLNNALRSNIDYVFFFQNSSKSGKEAIFKHYGGAFPNLRTFSDTIDKHANDYHCIVIDNKSTSDDIRDKVFKFKAKIHGDFKVGSQKYWEYHEKHYDKEYQEQRLFELSKKKKK